MVKFVISLLLLIPLLACKEDAVKKGKDVVKLSNEIQVLNETSLVILGTTQDAGSPQIGCKKNVAHQLKIPKIDWFAPWALLILTATKNIL